MFILRSVLIWNSDPSPPQKLYTYFFHFPGLDRHTLVTMHSHKSRHELNPAWLRYTSLIESKKSRSWGDPGCKLPFTYHLVFSFSYTFRLAEEVTGVRRK